MAVWALGRLLGPEALRALAERQLALERDWAVLQEWREALGQEWHEALA
jgi:hypothetical protein